jgi:hypothetical protein
MRALEILEQRIDQSESLLVNSWKRAKKNQESSFILPNKQEQNDFKISYSDYKILLEDLLRLRLRGNRKGRSVTNLEASIKGEKSFTIGDNIAQTIIELKDKLNTALDQKKFLQNSMENIMKRQTESENK